MSKMVITNNSNIDLTMAVWLMHDEYDYVKDTNYISVTGLMKPLRHIILPSRISKDADRTMDLEDLIPTALGHSLHDSIEKAWKVSYKSSLARLGYPQQMIDRVLINPTDEELDAHPNPIPVYLEQRAIKEFKGYRIGGKFDMVAQGIVHDNKSTSAYVWLHGTRDDEHCLQGSLYRWLNQDKITEDFIRINYIFTDYQKAQARQNPKYPQSRLQTKDIPLMSIAQTEDWVGKKLELINKYQNVPESQIPECTDEELWRSEPVFKYYADPSKTAKATKNFDTLSEAKMYQTEKGKGIVITKPGEAKRCDYCNAYDVCTQKDRF